MTDKHHHASAAADLVALSRAALADDAEATSAGLAGLLDALKVRDGEIGARIDKMEAARAAAVIDGDRAADTARGAAIEGERFDRNQCDALYVALTDKRATLEAREATQRQLKARAGVEQARTKAREALEHYPRHVAAIREILGLVASADGAAQTYARAYPDEPAFASVESESRRAQMGPEVVETKIEWAWVFGEIDAASFVVRSTDRFVPEGRHMTIQPDTEAAANADFFRSGWSNRPQARDFLKEIAKGALNVDPAHVFRTHNGTGERVWPGKVKRCEIVEPTPPVHSPLAAEVKLPPLRPGCAAWGLPADMSSPHAVLAALDVPLHGPQLQRRIERHALDDILVDVVIAPPPKTATPAPRGVEYALPA